MPRSTVLVILFVASHFIVGIVDAVLGWSDEFSSPTFMLHGLLIAVICFTWCKADVEERQVRMPTGSSILCGVLPLIGIPLHFYRTRTAKQASLAVLKSIGVLIIAMLGYELSIRAWNNIAA